MSTRVSRSVSVWLGLGAWLITAGVVHGASAPRVGFATRHGKSARLADDRSMGPEKPAAPRQVPNRIDESRGESFVSRSRTDAVAQRQFGASLPEPFVNFEGASDDDNEAVVGFRIVPPDTEGDVGPDHYVQFINNVATIYDKTGVIVLGPFKGNAFWAGLGGPCEIQNDGDPLVRYDGQADRWVVSQFALPNGPNQGPFYQCFAVSTTSDPTGEYWQYEFKTSDDRFTDYGKIGLWPDAYYMSFNMFPTDGSESVGGAYAFDRAAMLAGAPAGMIAFDTGAQTGVLPSDLDGPTPPPAGSPNSFMTFDVNPARLLQWRFHVDWATPANSTLSGPTEIPVAEFIYPVCDAFRGQCIPQLDTAEKLETLGERLMYRLVYRNFGDHESLVVNHTVGTEDGTAGLRWYEIRSPGNAPAIYQQGTFAPDSSFRWMGSMAMDGNGNMALGYSKSSSSTYPSIGVTGRLATDPLGTMGAETFLIAGGGSQEGSSGRWGDYSTMSIDPVDDCTFWYTQQYYAETGGFDFKTRVGAFRFPSCTNEAALEGTVTDGSNPVAGALITATPAGDAPSQADSTATTDGLGRYQFVGLNAGTYDVAVSKYGYVPVVVSGVVVSGGQTTVQDFPLQALPSVLVVGTVKDGSGQGWPLYARLIVSGPTGFPVTTIYSDPVTGYYSLPLLAGSYDFVVTSLVPGYEPGGGPLVVGAAPDAPTVVNWTLAASPSCTAPGYGAGAFVGPLVLSEGFDGGAIPAGWSVQTEQGASWKVLTGADPCGIPSGNQTGGSGPYAIINTNCEGLFGDVSSLVTPPIDLSGRTSAAIQWANDFLVNPDFESVASVDVSDDGGTTWTNVWQRNSDLAGPGPQEADISLVAGHANVVARFHYSGLVGMWWQVDDVKVGTFACVVTPGGLVVGTVSDANTGAGLTGATVENLSDGGSTTSVATPGNGFYSLFADGGSTSFRASFPDYSSTTRDVTVVPGSTTRLDFALPSGSLSAAPRPLQAFVAPGTVEDRTLTLSNTGSAAGAFRIQEIGVAPVASASNPVSSRPTQPPAPTDAPEITLGNAGNVVSSFPTGLDFGFGIVYDTSIDRLWVVNPYFPDFGINGDGLAHQYLPDGTATGETIDIHDTGGVQQADGTYNGRTGMLWQVNVGGDQCLFEMDPVTKVVTGDEICGRPDTWQGNSQRSLAYDYATDTYYVGGVNGTVLYHVDSAGQLLESVDIGLPSAGLAYNPTTRHLFLLTENAAPWDVWVMAPHEDYAILGGFRIVSGGVPVLQLDGIGLEAACDGRLRVNARNTNTVYAFESGETGWCVNEIPWLSENPAEGSVPPSSSLPVTLTFDGRGLLPGLRQASLGFATDTPTSVSSVPVDFTILFNDVPQGSFAWNYIYGAAGAGVMPGCAPQTPTFTFCPSEVVTRRSMAGFIERALRGALTPPPVYLGGFQDVVAGSFNANYIQGLVDDRITAGCNVDPALYCPDNPVTRAQMAVFLWRALNGDEAPPACSGVFDDVGCPSQFADYIEGIAALGITAGCGGDHYCPNFGITNAQMAVFLVKAFGLAYLP